MSWCARPLCALTKLQTDIYSIQVQMFGPSHMAHQSVMSDCQQPVTAPLYHCWPVCIAAAGGMRQLHWHLNFDEWQYVINVS